ncbi:hypothetical protein RvY_04625 [Ramazzottius varieornatus]|uniref:Peptidase C1A papain C-terminal domain-containing protein n=1 Tax=Ramazzottius varieornatus TaxID=947166 RepID=A0A1D1USW6_RAMVA|nr:hypothetical protein RvY_04625 [Ramazzottius varieornatus]
MEILNLGPVTAGIAADDKSKNLRAHEIYRGPAPDDPNAFKHITHQVRIIGWNKTLDGTPYWIVSNSWGADWGTMVSFMSRWAAMLLE